MSQDNITQGALPFPRVVRTTHTEDGTSVFASDDKVVPFAPFGPKLSSFAVFDSRGAVPVNNTDIIPPSASVLPRCPPGGAIFATTDFPPGGRAPMHRTQSLDYAIVLSGEIVIGLDGGESKTVKAGEFIVQQGVNHEWINETQQVCRIVFVMLSSDQIVLKDGRVLEEKMPSRPNV